MKIFVHRRKTEKNEQVGGVQRVHTHLYIYVITLGFVKCKGDVLLRAHPRERER